MKLRNQFLTLSLATLMVPWFGWKLVQELERFLRAGQESALLATARTIARALPAQHQSELMFGRENILHLRDLPAAPHLDGYDDDWPAPDQAARFTSQDGLLILDLMAGRYSGQVYLFCRVLDASPVRETDPGAAPGAVDAVDLYLRTPRELTRFRVQTAAPGPLLLHSQSGGGGQVEGYWLDTSGGYQLELSLPIADALVDFGIVARDAMSNFGRTDIMRRVGTVGADGAQRWLRLATRDESLDQWLSGVVPPGSRAWIMDNGAWVMGDSGASAPPAGRELSFAERLLYRAVAGERTEVIEARPDQVVRFGEPLVLQALEGGTATHWGQDPDSARVRNSVAVPIELGGAVAGAVLIESDSDGLLLVTNRVLGRLLLSTLLVTFGLALGLWYFATRLSRRVQRLSTAVSEAMDETGRAGTLPLIRDRDELGELARNNAALLDAVSGYTSYLQKLAGRLSHELKTPLAITRSSLDNLASHDLDDEATRYLARAREGLDRQSAIVAAMSEATRLEAAVESAEWASVDLVELIERCVDAYRALHPNRQIDGPGQAEPLICHCAPDLLAQALDKLVENAISLTREDDVVRINVAGRGEQCRIQVSNTGSRLPDVPADQLFDSLVSHRGQGSGRHLGLGLHIVRLVARAHQGHVTAESLPGGDGAVFTISIPLETA